MDREDLLIQRSSLVLRQGVIRLLVMKILTTFYRRMFLMVRPLNTTIPYMHPRLPVTIQRLTEKDLSAYSRFRPDQCMNVIRARLTRGDQFFAAWNEGHIVHAVWVSIERVYVPYLRRDLILQPGDVYLYDSFTSPAYRGYDLAAARSVHMMHHYQQEGYRRMVCLIAVENESGLRAVQKLGYQSVGLCSCLCCGPWQHDLQQTWSEEPLPRLAKVA
jgi:ribosomal protein S18 acetylase RimI-like enzyme